MNSDELYETLIDAAEHNAAADDRAAELQRAVNAAWHIAQIHIDDECARQWLDAFGALVTDDSPDEKLARLTGVPYWRGARHPIYVGEL